MRSLHIREVFLNNGPTEFPNSSLIPSGEVRHLISKMSSGLGGLLTGSQRLPRGRRKQRWLLIEAPRCFRSEGSVRGQIISGIIRLPLFPENLLFSFSLQVSERKGVLEIYLKISKKRCGKSSFTLNLHCALPHLQQKGSPAAGMCRARGLNPCGVTTLLILEGPTRFTHLLRCRTRLRWRLLPRVSAPSSPA